MWPNTKALKMIPDYELKVVESTNGVFKMRITCPECGDFVVPKGMPLKFKYITDTGKNAIADGYMFLSPGEHDCSI